MQEKTIVTFTSINRNSIFRAAIILACQPAGTKIEFKRSPGLEPDELPEGEIYVSSKDTGKDKALLLEKLCHARIKHFGQAWPALGELLEKLGEYVVNYHKRIEGAGIDLGVLHAMARQAIPTRLSCLIAKEVEENTLWIESITRAVEGAASYLVSQIDASIDAAVMTHLSASAIRHGQGIFEIPLYFPAFRKTSIQGKNWKGGAKSIIVMPSKHDSDVYFIASPYFGAGVMDLLPDHMDIYVKGAKGAPYGEVMEAAKRLASLADRF